MRSSIAWPGLAAVLAAGCEHPAASARLQGPAPEQSVAVLADAPITVGEQAVLAHRTLQRLLGEHASAPSESDIFKATAISQPGPLPTPAWLETQSALLRTLAGRSRAAAVAVGTDDPK
jgi:hypothetical protein